MAAACSSFLDVKPPEEPKGELYCQLLATIPAAETLKRPQECGYPLLKHGQPPIAYGMAAVRRWPTGLSEVVSPAVIHEPTGSKANDRGNTRHGEVPAEWREHPALARLRGDWRDEGRDIGVLVEGA
jgi:hypothetical protein